MATVIALHAHPDDEVLLTGGTLAMLAAAGHQVRIVFATDGSAGLAVQQGPGLGRTRVREAEAASEALGLLPPRWLGYADSGEAAQRPAGAFADVDVDEAAGRLAAILRDYGADALLTYDEAGGYGHPDHQQAHRVAVAAAREAGTPRVLQATVDRTALGRAVALLRLIPGLPASFTAARLTQGFTARENITHRLDVSGAIEAKRNALAAHASQSSGGGEMRTLALLLRLPTPLLRRVLGHEWFREEALLGAGLPHMRTDLGLPEPPPTTCVQTR
jgi:LmbE family N-acetylglucosaminyl deacetylase